ncbi:asparagine synthase (glutamine-hydrolyzing) [Intrasporangium calvum]|uniref:asparagine synthase (glutamine-hydrolyzing) n=1 Tax=Intrasporangium calvum (strain ATCC 23552 / DSM 43043 / JCM 3097 / NBRC 12989 / NCIMB 10167 / NRRL B-3866 / 7 KIP) TaxID=710696 RepID=E6SDD7_INTC7|nr:asparagine synthase (glutamine-hydrolyzing) [Intrasporangium calvum]ADU47559.1 asparagine synthase (glutamine-hydrolyzing) [Intrasporangium calvum DSM 43043]
MCGIAGYLGIEADEALLQRMNDCQVHRGPDGDGLFTDGPVGLAHRRLSIIDRAHGQQPMTTRDGRFTIVYNGEVYNYLPLRAELEGLGHTFTTDSDTEVVLQSFAQWGAEAFDRFNGMFGLAIWDAQERSLTLARDHFGIKPVYVCRSAGSGAGGADAWLFASEIKPILASGRYERRPNERTIYRYLRFRIHEDGRETFFDGIERLEPGEVMTIAEDGTVERRPFTRLREELLELAREQRPYDEAAAREYRDRLTEAVRLRLQSEVPVGTSLSGGLDSSAVAVIINRLLNEHDRTAESVGAQQNTFSAVFPGSINDEERYVDDVLEICKGHVAGHKITPTPTEFKEDLADFVRTQEEPLISSGPYAQYQVMREATKHVTVLLDGQGADEMMAGYIPYYFVYLRQLRAQGALRAAAELSKSLDVLYRLGRFKLKAKLRGRKSIPTTQLLAKGFVAAHAGERYTVEGSNLKKRLVEDLFVGSLPSLLRYEDKNTMRFSLEGRVPFLDKEVVKYIFSLSDEAIIKDGWNKRILRDATRDLLPESINRRRNKIGFTTPQGEWFMRLKNHFYGIFLSESFAARPYFDQTEVLHAFEGWIKGTNDVDSMTFWRLLNLELWLQEYFDEKVDEAAQGSVSRVKTDYEPNARKQLDLTLDDGQVVRRYPLRTELYAREDDLDSKTLGYIDRFFAGLPEAGADHEVATKGTWYFFISEKIVAITQGRSYFIWDIKVSRPARILSRYVTRTPAGIGLGSPFTMQLAIEEAGLARVLYASAGGAVGKLVGRRGLFYDLVGGDIRAIDGPTEYSVYPANVSAKLAPKDPDQVAARLSAAIRERVPAPWRDTFGGTVVMDANDIGRNVLGTDAPGLKERYEAMFADNPLGQGSEQTPMAIVFELT